MVFRARIHDSELNVLNHRGLRRVGQKTIKTKIETGTGTGTENVAPPRSLRGTGGTDLIRFLKNVRDRTSEATLPSTAP
jgi:hypothetical protein